MLLSTSTRMVLGISMSSWCSGCVVADDVTSHVTHGVSSELHDVTGDLLDPITSNAMLSTPMMSLSRSVGVLLTRSAIHYTLHATRSDSE